MISNTLLSRVIFFTFRKVLGNCKSATKACKERLRKLVENFQNFGRSKCGTHLIKVHKFNFSISSVSVLLLVHLSLTNQRTAKQRYQERLTNTLRLKRRGCTILANAWLPITQIVKDAKTHTGHLNTGYPNTGHTQSEYSRQ